VRILDKYLLREFLWPLVYCFDAFAMLLIAIDLFDKLPDFLQYHARAGQVVRYYVYIFPDIFVQIVPMSLLLGLLFCLSNLGKHNELIAMRASGLSLTRLAAPLLAIGAAASLLVFAVSELFVPRGQERAEMFLLNLKGRAKKGVLENFFFTNVRQNRDWYAREFRTDSSEMVGPEIHEENPDGTPRRDIYAERAQWVNGVWWFYGASIHDHANQRQPFVRVAETNFPFLSESPRRLALEASASDPDRMTSAQLRRYIRTQKRAGGTSHLADYQVTLHYRYAFPLICLIVIWIGIPLGMRFSRSGPLLSIGTALILIVAFYFITHITLALGRGDRIPPLLAAWLANFIFAGIGAFLLTRAR
jgi:lipopolysaccharide export system permease protein